MKKSKIGVLLVNLGTPDGADITSVRRFLKEFLDDPRVIDLPGWMRKGLLYAAILPFRPKKTAKSYAAIWDNETGSPLLYHTLALSKELQKSLGENYQVEVGMRYGQPSIATALETLLAHHCRRIKVLPLFPQYSSAASGSAIESFLRSVQNQWNIPEFTVCPAFYDDPQFIQAQAELIRGYLKLKPDKILFSYHSLPVRHIRKSNSDCIGCNQNSSCPALTDLNYNCYRAQCYETSRLIAKDLNLDPEHFEVVFQSRLGRTAWVGPDLQKLLPEMLKKGVKNVLISSPSFVADCLETLEEIGIRAQREWYALGGKQFTLVPCLNSSPAWVKAVDAMVR